MSKRYHIEVEPGCVGTFSTPSPSPETLRILRDVIRMAMAAEDRRVRDGSGTPQAGNPAEEYSGQPDGGNPPARPNNDQP